MSASLLTAMTEIDATPLSRTGFVYALVAGDQIIYIGQTTAIAQRLWMHRAGTKKCAPKQFDRAFVLEVDANDLSAYEGALIRRFNPPLCWSAPSDDSRDGEVLATLGLTLDPVASAAFEGRRRALWSEAWRCRRVREWSNRQWKRVRFSSVLWRTAVRHLKRSAS